MSGKTHLPEDWLPYPSAFLFVWFGEPKGPLPPASAPAEPDAVDAGSGRVSYPGMKDESPA